MFRPNTFAETAVSIVFACLIAGALVPVFFAVDVLVRGAEPDVAIDSAAFAVVFFVPLTVLFVVVAGTPVLLISQASFTRRVPWLFPWGLALGVAAAITYFIGGGALLIGYYVAAAWLVGTVGGRLAARRWALSWTNPV